MPMGKPQEISPGSRWELTKEFGLTLRSIVSRLAGHPLFLFGIAAMLIGTFSVIAVSFVPSFPQLGFFPYALLIFGIMLIAFAYLKPLNLLERNPAIIEHYVDATKWPLVLDELFNNNYYEWEVGKWDNDYSTGEKQIINGKYRITLTTKIDHLPIMSFYPPEFSNFYVACDIIQLEGPVVNSCGLVFRYIDGVNYYSFRIKRDRTFAVSIFYQHKWEDLLRWDVNTAINTVGPNRLSVISVNGVFTFWINGSYAGKVEDNRLPQGKIAFWAGGSRSNVQSVYEYDNFEIRLPNKSSSY